MPASKLTWFLHTIYMAAVFPPWCGASSDKCLLLWHRLLGTIVITWEFSQTNWFNFIRITRLISKHSPFNFTQYAALPHNTEIVMWLQTAVTSLHYVHVTSTVVVCIAFHRMNPFTKRGRIHYGKKSPRSAALGRTVAKRTFIKMFEVK